jgi:hypothetical protein
MSEPQPGNMGNITINTDGPTTADHARKLRISGEKEKEVRSLRISS